MEKVSVSQRLAELDKEIAETEAALKDVHGTETEVYARIVGYYRAVKHWNKGKRDEFDLRKVFTLDASQINTKLANIETTEPTEPIETNLSEDISSDITPLELTSENISSNNTDSNSDITYEIYTKQTCPNCPPVKAFMANLEGAITGTAIDVDTSEGLAKAAKNGVFASPTVIFYDSQNNIEIGRCHCVEELENLMTTVEELHSIYQKVAVLN